MDSLIYLSFTTECAHLLDPFFSTGIIARFDHSNQAFFDRPDAEEAENVPRDSKEKDGMGFS